MGGAGLMARLADLRDRVVLRLAAELGLELAAAVGHRELLNHAAFGKADPVLGDALDVELSAEWHGGRGAFVAAAVSAGLIRQLDDDAFEIVDFWELAPAWVAKRRDRAEARRALGKSVSDLRSEAGKKGAETRRSKRETSGGRLLPTRKQKSGLPSLLPSPPPALLPEQEREGGSRPPDPPTRAGFNPPTEDEWLRYAAETWPDWPEADVRSAWAHYEAGGWRRGRAPIRDWHAAAKTCYHRQEGRRTAAPRPAENPAAIRALVGSHSAPAEGKRDPHAAGAPEWVRAVARAVYDTHDRPVPPRALEAALYGWEMGRDPEPPRGWREQLEAAWLAAKADPVPAEVRPA